MIGPRADSRNVQRGSYSPGGSSNMLCLLHGTLFQQSAYPTYRPHHRVLVPSPRRTARTALIVFRGRHLLSLVPMLHNTIPVPPVSIHHILALELIMQPAIGHLERRALLPEVRRHLLPLGAEGSPRRGGPVLALLGLGVVVLRSTARGPRSVFDTRPPPVAARADLRRSRPR